MVAIINNKVFMDQKWISIGHTSYILEKKYSSLSCLSCSCEGIEERKKNKTIRSDLYFKLRKF